MLNQILNKFQSVAEHESILNQAVVNLDLTDAAAANAGRTELTPSHQRRIRRRSRQLSASRPSVGGWKVKMW